MQTDKLKPCPFCGSTELSDMGEYIGCADCEADGPFNFDVDPTAAARKWNTRPLSMTGEMVEALSQWAEELNRGVAPRAVAAAMRRSIAMQEQGE